MVTAPGVELFWLPLGADPPDGGRAPGWDAGVALLERQCRRVLATRTP